MEEIKRGDEFLSSIIVKNVKSGRAEELAVGGVFLYVGQYLIPNLTGLVDLNESGYVLTKEDMSTKTPGLFVAGDIRQKLLRQVATAVGDGAVAAWTLEKYLIDNFM